MLLFFHPVRTTAIQEMHTSCISGTMELNGRILSFQSKQTVVSLSLDKHGLLSPQRVFYSSASPREQEPRSRNRLEKSHWAQRSVSVQSGATDRKKRYHRNFCVSRISGG